MARHIGIMEMLFACDDLHSISQSVLELNGQLKGVCKAPRLQVNKLASLVGTIGYPHAVMVNLGWADGIKAKRLVPSAGGTWRQIRHRLRSCGILAPGLIAAESRDYIVFMYGCSRRSQASASTNTVSSVTLTPHTSKC